MPQNHEVEFGNGNVLVLTSGCTLLIHCNNVICELEGAWSSHQEGKCHHINDHLFLNDFYNDLRCQLGKNDRRCLSYLLKYYIVCLFVRSCEVFHPTLERRLENSKHEIKIENEHKYVILTILTCSLVILSVQGILRILRYMYISNASSLVIVILFNVHVSLAYSNDDHTYAFNSLTRVLFLMAYCKAVLIPDCELDLDAYCRLIGSLSAVEMRMDVRMHLVKLKSVSDLSDVCDSCFDDIYRKEFSQALPHYCKVINFYVIESRDTFPANI
ncbi:hypothetical protein GQR58_006588 [Nymphon striatum]|nr:hypothetical protein GQR58_006588 [Nymphon striatum]